MRYKTRTLAVVVIAASAALGLAACDSDHATASPASCTFIVGDGQHGRNADLHRIVYPGQVTKLSQDGNSDNTENPSYVPCNSRNFIINDGKQVNANGQKVGDRGTPTVAYTDSGVQITVWSTAYWTLNQSKQAMDDFYSLCFKYSCASPTDQGGGANFSTPGWNGMLSENFAPAMDAVVDQAAFATGDDIWKTHNPSLYKALADQMSKNFADAIRVKDGKQDDLFCGSGNSGWQDPSKPGSGTYTCSPVRFTVDRVEVVPVSSNTSTNGATELNRQRLLQAEALYGGSAGYWLGIQDSIKSCPQGSTCVFNLGGGSGTTLTVPSAK